jgi:hypothetical protein
MKVWTYETADKKFSKLIIERDKKCLCCGTNKKRLNCSHYWNRQHYSTRYNFDNCIALCVSCHTLNRDNWEADRKGEYRAFMIKRLGKKGFKELEIKHNKRVKRRDAIIQFMEYYKQLGK